jgi:5-methylcytosine-specific restriction endonuclease McrA
MTFKNIQDKKFNPVGCCIYCGNDGGKEGLRTEHIISYSSGGKAELPEASCRNCERITSYLDGYLAKRVFSITAFMLKHKPGAPKNAQQNCPQQQL